MINKCFIDCKTKKYSKHNRYKQYLLADSGYDSINNHNILIKKGYTPLIKQNRKNIKNKKLIRKFNKKQKEIYKKRIIIENYHSWIKKFSKTLHLSASVLAKSNICFANIGFSKIKSLYERNICSYRGLLLIEISIIVHRRIIKNKK